MGMDRIRGLQRIELIGKVIEKPRLIDETDWLVQLETEDKSRYEVFLKHCKRWLKLGVMVKVAGIIREHTILAFSCKQYRGEG